MVVKMIDECSTLKTKEDIEEFLRYMNDPYDITPEGARLLEEAEELAKSIPLDEL